MAPTKFQMIYVDWKNGVIRTLSTGTSGDGSFGVAYVGDRPQGLSLPQQYKQNYFILAYADGAGTSGDVNLYMQQPGSLKLNFIKTIVNVNPGLGGVVSGLETDGKYIYVGKFPSIGFTMQLGKYDFNGKLIAGFANLQTITDIAYDGRQMWVLSQVGRSPGDRVHQVLVNPKGGPNELIKSYDLGVTGITEAMYYDGKYLVTAETDAFAVNPKLVRWLPAGGLLTRVDEMAVSINSLGGATFDGRNMIISF
jgi:hypothetical protein